MKLAFPCSNASELAFLCSNEREVTLTHAQMSKPMGLIFEESGGQDKSIVRPPPPLPAHPVPEWPPDSIPPRFTTRTGVPRS